MKRRQDEIQNLRLARQDVEGKITEQVVMLEDAVSEISQLRDRRTLVTSETKDVIAE